MHIHNYENNTHYYAGFGCSPAQYHGVIDRLWKVLGKSDAGVQDKDVFTQCEEKIMELEESNRLLQRELDITNEIAIGQTDISIKLAEMIQNAQKALV